MQRLGTLRNITDIPAVREENPVDEAFTDRRFAEYRGGVDFRPFSMRFAACLWLAPAVFTLFVLAVHRRLLVQCAPPRGTPDVLIS
jgi:hypothetical protein